MNNAKVFFVNFKLGQGKKQGNSFSLDDGKVIPAYYLTKQRVLSDNNLK
jgi:aromatic ring-opening dioxygenase LigB subunit